jgi:hypothetical protein
LALSGFDYEVDILDCDAVLWRDAFSRNPPPGREALIKEARSSVINEMMRSKRGGYGANGVDGCLFDPAKGIGVAGRPTAHVAWSSLLHLEP